jgi:hypothetical protein
MFVSSAHLPLLGNLHFYKSCHATMQQHTPVRVLGHCTSVHKARDYQRRVDTMRGMTAPELASQATHLHLQIAGTSEACDPDRFDELIEEQQVLQIITALRDLQDSTAALRAAMPSPPMQGGGKPLTSANQMHRTQTQTGGTSSPHTDQHLKAQTVTAMDEKPAVGGSHDAGLSHTGVDATTGGMPETSAITRTRRVSWKHTVTARPTHSRRADQELLADLIPTSPAASDRVSSPETSRSTSPATVQVAEQKLTTDQSSPSQTTDDAVREEETRKAMRSVVVRPVDSETTTGPSLTSQAEGAEPPSKRRLISASGTHETVEQLPSQSTSRRHSSSKSRRATGHSGSGRSKHQSRRHSGRRH